MVGRLCGFDPARRPGIPHHHIPALHDLVHASPRQEIAKEIARELVGEIASELRQEIASELRQEIASKLADEIKQHVSAALTEALLTAVRAALRDHRQQAAATRT